MNLCRGCNEDFGGVELFDRHRVGKHAYTYAEGLDKGLEDGRRCLDVEEMEMRGWTRNQYGRWFDPSRGFGMRQKPPPERTAALVGA